MSEQRACPHCGRINEIKSALHEGAYWRHVTRCLWNPSVEKEMLDFMKANAVNGVAMTSKEYNQKAGGNAPRYHSVRERFGTWQDFCAWCGLRDRQSQNAKDESRRADRWAAVIAAVDADSAAARAAERDAFDWRKMPCIARGPRTYYDWRTRSYRTDEVMELR